MKTIGITGGSGFVGTHVSGLLVNMGYRVIIFTRHAGKKAPSSGLQYAHWDPEKETCDIKALKEVDGIVHLAGAGIADKRWTEKRKQEIIDSRLKGTSFLVNQVMLHAQQCKVLVSASAIGFYGADNGQEPFTEDMPPATDFLGITCIEWEQASAFADDFLRRVVLRFGIVLGKESGAFKEFEGPTRWGVAPILGSGKQVISWIHIDDLSRLIVAAIENENMRGVYNAVSPEPVTNAALMKSIRKHKKGIQIPVHVPAFALKMALGEMSTEVLKSCTVSNSKVQSTGFTYQYPSIDAAVEQLVR
jgi:uncharacterized protein (TIGR01777 family)